MNIYLFMHVYMHICKYADIRFISRSLDISL